MNSNLIAELESQKKTVQMTLEHLRAHQNEVESNTEWKDLHAQRRRSELLSDLLDWYNARLQRIEHDLGQMGSGRRRPAQTPSAEAAPTRRNI